MKPNPRPQEIYRHFKGNLYQVLTLAEHSEDGEMLVIYQALYGDFRIYARPLESFVSRVDREKYPDADQEYRFELQQMGAGTVKPADDVQAAGSTDETREWHENVPCAGGADKAVKTCSTGETPKMDVSAEDSETKITGGCAEEEITLDPLVWEFLDADSHEQRLNILAALHHRITDDMLTTMAVACDVEIGDGDVEERYSQLKNCLIMLDRFEIRR